MYFPLIHKFTRATLWIRSEIVTFLTQKTPPTKNYLGSWAAVSFIVSFNRLLAWNHFDLLGVGKIDVKELIVDSNRQPLVSFRVALNEVKRFIGSPVAR